MDLILLQPGDADVFFGSPNDWNHGGSLVDKEWRDEVLSLGQCIELASVRNTDLSMVIRQPIKDHRHWRDYLANGVVERGRILSFSITYCAATGNDGCPTSVVCGYSVRPTRCNQGIAIPRRPDD
jgi:hypothetical protein